MAYWFIPFAAISMIILGVLSVVVVEYHDQKSRRFDRLRNL